MKLKYTGNSDRRVVQGTVWTPGSFEDVDEGLGQQLIEKHGDEFFRIDEDTPDLQLFPESQGRTLFEDDELDVEGRSVDAIFIDEGRA